MTQSQNSHITDQILYEYFDAHGQILSSTYLLLNDPPEGTSKIVKVKQTFKMVNERKWVLRDDNGVEVTEPPPHVPSEVVHVEAADGISHGIYESFDAVKGFMSSLVSGDWVEGDHGRTMTNRLCDDDILVIARKVYVGLESHLPKR